MVRGEIISGRAKEGIDQVIIVLRYLNISTLITPFLRTQVLLIPSRESRYTLLHRESLSPRNLPVFAHPLIGRYL